jgi:hypothetical protein
MGRDSQVVRSVTIPHLSICEIAEKLNISVEAAFALVKASLREKKSTE